MGSLLLLSTHEINFFCVFELICFLCALSGIKQGAQHKTPDINICFRNRIGESEEPPTPPKTPVVVEQQLDNDGDDEREDSDTLGCRDDDDDDYDEEEEEDYEICDENGKLKQPLDLPTNLNDESLEAIRTRISDLTRLAALHNPAVRNSY